MQAFLEYFLIYSIMFLSFLLLFLGDVLSSHFLKIYVGGYIILVPTYLFIQVSLITNKNRAKTCYKQGLNNPT